MFYVLLFASFAAAGELKPTWMVSDGLDSPESAFYDAKTDAVYVSNVAGKPHEKDARGWITKISTEGQILAAKFVDGLDAPKGMRSWKGQLWVADIDRVVVVDMKTGKISRHIPVPDSNFLNDVAVTDKGEVFVSDTLTSRIYRVAPGKPKVWMSGKALQSPNGLFVKDNRLHVASWGFTDQPDFSTKEKGSVWSVEIAKGKSNGNQNVVAVSQAPLGQLDGLEWFDGSFYVSDWVAGKVFRLDAKGKASEFLTGIKGSADIGVIPKKRLLLVPSMSDNKVLSFKI